MRTEAKTGGTASGTQGRLEPQKAEEEEGPSPGASGGSTALPGSQPLVPRAGEEEFRSREGPGVSSSVTSPSANSRPACLGDGP